MNKLKFILVITALIAGTCTYEYYSFNEKHYIIDDIEFISKEDFLSKYSKDNGVFKDDDIDAEFVTYDIDLSNIEDLSLLDKFYYKNHTDSIEIPVTYKVDKIGLRKFINTKYNKHRKDAIDAKIEKTEKGFVIRDAKDGTKVDADKVISAVNKDETQIDLKKCYKAPKVIGNDLVPVMRNLNKYLYWSCTYTDKYKISPSLEDIDIDENYNPVLKYDFLTTAIDELAKKYNTVGQPKKFKTSNGNKVTITGGTLGTIVDKDAELAFLTEKFNSGEVVKKRTPKFSLDIKDIGNDYIEVSIAQQHMWLYRNGVCVSQSDVVTGTNTNPKRQTPTGAFYMLERKPGTTLRPSTGGAVWVDRWMRVTWDGVGLHDASWRGVFGGNIYQYNGSHGCINLPKNYAYQLYPETFDKMPIVIY